MAAAPYERYRTELASRQPLKWKLHFGLWGPGMVDYKGYRIDVGAFPDLLDATFPAKSVIRNARGEVVSGTTANCIRMIGDAEREAYRSARKWIDAQNLTTTSALVAPSSQRTGQPA